MNNTNICPIICKATKFNEIKNSLQHYQNETRQHIQNCLGMGIKNSKYPNKISQSKINDIIRYILSNEDIFSHMMTAIMLADSTWDKDKSSLKYWRNKNCIWTLNKVFYKNKKRLYNYGILSTNRLPIDDLILKEENEIIQARIDALDLRSKKIISLYYKDHFTEQKIAKIFKITQQRVNQILQKTMIRLKNE